MTQKTKKLLLFLAVFLGWFALDIISKDWADATLANRNHPRAARITAEEAGKPLRDVLSARYGWSPDEAREHLFEVERLEPAGGYAATDKPYGPGPAATARGFYVFWRSGPEDAPRRIDKNERSLITSWLSLAIDKKDAPKEQQDADRIALQQKVNDLVGTWTFATWLPERFRKLDADDVGAIAPAGIHPVASTPGRLDGDELVQAGETYLLTDYHIDVMGDWWKFVYAENPNAAFGFMKGIPEGTRHLLFTLLNILAFIVIGSIVWRLPPTGWVVYAAFAGIFAGAAGNFFDRLRFGYVIDFIDWDLGFTHWPTFNVADIAISVGVVALIIDITFNKNSPLVSKKKPKKGSGDVEGDAEATAKKTATA